MIKIDNLLFQYSKEKQLFEGLNLSLSKGSIVGLFGKNGAGKTTLIKILSGLIFPKKGSCQVLAHTPAQRSPSFLNDIYFLPEEVGEFSGRIEQYVSLYGSFYPKFSEEQFASMLSDFGMGQSDYLKHLSFGQRKQFYISFGLATNCSLIIMDEPTNGLDIPSKRTFRKLVAASMDDEKCILISTHQVRDLGNLIDRVVILEGGQIVFNHSLDSISKSYDFVQTDLGLEDDQVIYKEEGLGQVRAILKSSGQDISKVDFEMLFSGVVLNPQEFKISDNE